MESKKPTVSVIVALGKNRAIGYKNALLWQVPDDLKRFKTLTTSHPVIMGRNTYASIFAMLGKPLPERTSVVITYPNETTDPMFAFPNVALAHSPQEAIEKARTLDATEIFIGGGAQIYRQMLPMADRLYLTLIDDEKVADTFFPPYESIFTKKVSEESREHNGLTYRWVTLEK